MSTRQIAASTLWQVASQFAMAVLSTIAVKCVALGLEKELAGVYNSSYGYLQLFSILSDFGLYAVSVRELSRAENRERILGGLIVLRSAIMALSLGSAIVIAWILPAWQGTPLPTAIAIASLVPAFTLLAGMLRTIFQIQYKMHLVFIAEVSQRVVTVGLMLALIFSGVRSSGDPKLLDAFLWIGSASALWLFLLSTIFAVRLMRIRPCFDREVLRMLLRASAPYGLAFLCVALYRQSDLTIIALLRPDFQLQNAYYGFVGRITEMTYLIPTFLLNSTLPVLVTRQTTGERTDSLLGKTLLVILLLGSTAALFSILWARPVIGLLTTSSYLSTSTTAGSDTALQILSGSMFMNGLVLFSFYVLLTLHQWRPLVKRMCIAVVASLGLNLLLVPKFGFVGAAITSVGVHALLVVLLLPIALRAMPVRLTISMLLRVLMYCVLVGTGLILSEPLLTTDLSTVVAGALSLVLIGALGWALGLKRALV